MAPRRGQVWLHLTRLALLKFLGLSTLFKRVRLELESSGLALVLAYRVEAVVAVGPTAPPVPKRVPLISNQIALLSTKIAGERDEPATPAEAQLVHREEPLQHHPPPQIQVICPNLLVISCSTDLLALGRHRFKAAVKAAPSG